MIEPQADNEGIGRTECQLYNNEQVLAILATHSYSSFAILTTQKELSRFHWLGRWGGGVTRTAQMTTSRVREFVQVAKHPPNHQVHHMWVRRWCNSQA